MNFNKTLVQNFFSPKHELTENCLKIEKIIGRESMNECKEVKQCESLRVTKGKIVFRQYKKKNIGEEFQKILLSFMNKKASNTCLDTAKIKPLKNTQPYSCPVNKLEDYYYLNDINYLNISSHSSDGKRSPKKVIRINNKKSLPIFTKFDIF